jgi:SAM-dependent methyltransferase
MCVPRTVEFTCNICGSSETFRSQHYLDPELLSCESCGSNVRFRWLVYRFSTEILGRSLPLWEFPFRPAVKGVGLTDPECIAKTLRRSFTYLNTFFDREPRFDICGSGSPFGELDFIIASEVVEHVAPPVQRAFDNAARLLKPGGVLLLTTPWVWDGDRPLPELYDWKLAWDGSHWMIADRQKDGREVLHHDVCFDDSAGPSLGYTREHFPNLNEWALVGERGSAQLHNRLVDGSVEVFQNLVFHGGSGETLEMRLFTKRDLEKRLQEAGFREIRFEIDDYPEHGIIFGYPWGRPIIARRQFAAATNEPETCL